MERCGFTRLRDEVESGFFQRPGKCLKRRIALQLPVSATNGFLRPMFEGVAKDEIGVDYRGESRQ